jgi:Asp-tRNA(Asn)/Glu-tRNA(Gln) amidotransferase A subunit family amidase
MAPTDVLNLTIREAAAQIERSALSPVELTDAMLQRIAHVDKTLNA